MPNRPRRTRTAKQVETLTHEAASRPNIPTAEYQSMLDEEDRSPIEVAYARRNRDLDPQLVWRGKDEQDASDLVVQAPPLFIQEKVHPKVLIDDLMRRTTRTEADQAASTEGFQYDLFADFNGLPEGADKTDFYAHEANWANRMILGDSLQVMASLAEREGLRGKVQCIYIDPPYGIRFNSNFQWSTTSRDVRDGNAAHITREPEQVKAFRDTWRDGVHSYLSYLRDRLAVARDLLADTGSLFVQIGDENLHRVRALLDEVFGDTNYVNLITFQKTSSSTSGYLGGVADYLLWYAKHKEAMKFRAPFYTKEIGAGSFEAYNKALLPNGAVVGLSEIEDSTELADVEIIRIDNITSQSIGRDKGEGAASWFPVHVGGRVIRPNLRVRWKTNEQGMSRLQAAGRLWASRNSLGYIRRLSDFRVAAFHHVWSDTVISGSALEKSYVVETLPLVVQRCLLMTTDPGDLVLDPTCGSGTTAYVAEQWGRRWITIDTSRVALALARARIMGARYPYYLLADSREGQLKEAEVTRTASKDTPTRGDIRHGFVYERVPHIQLRDIANNAEIDVIWEQWERTLAPLREELSAAAGQQQTLEEWEIPRERPSDWPPTTEPLLTSFWESRIARQREIDASIAAKAEFEYLYDRPYEDNRRVRVAGPFTVESLSPHRVLGVDEDGELIDGLKETSEPYGKPQDFGTMVLDHLRTAGVQQAHKEDRIDFTSLTPWPGRFVAAEGRYIESAPSPSASSESVPSPGTGEGEGGGPSEDAPGVEKRAAIFIGPEFGTVSRPDLVEAAREAADANFDVLIACAFNYEAHTSEFNRLGRVPVLKARMNADLHMAGELKNTGAGNLFVIFGEPDVEVVSGQWLVASGGRLIANYDRVVELSGLGSLEEINRLGGSDLPRLKALSSGRAVRTDQSTATIGGVRAGEHRGGSGEDGDGRVPPVPQRGERIAGGSGDAADPRGPAGTDPAAAADGAADADLGDRPDAGRPETLAATQTQSVSELTTGHQSQATRDALASLRPSDFPLRLTTNHLSQVTVRGVDVFHPNTGEVRSDGPEGIACWFIDTDYNEESFFVRHAYFLGQNDPYRALRTTLKAEINEEAWESLHSAVSRPFDKPESGRIAVKVINHLGDEVMKVFRVE